LTKKYQSGKFDLGDFREPLGFVFSGSQKGAYKGFLSTEYYAIFEILKTEYHGELEH
jgi:hypothetical protein